MPLNIHTWMRKTYLHPHTIFTQHYKFLNFLKCRNTTATWTIDEMPHFASYSSQTLESAIAKCETKDNIPNSLAITARRAGWNCGGHWDSNSSSSVGTLNYLFTPCSRVLLDKLNGPNVVNKSSAFSGSRRFITASTSVCHLSLSSANSTKFISSTLLPGDPS